MIQKYFFPTKVESLDVIVKKNQAFIVTHFSKTREHFCDHLLGEGKKEDTSMLASLKKHQGSSPEEGKRKDTRLALLIKVESFNLKLIMK